MGNGTITRPLPSLPLEHAITGWLDASVRVFEIRESRRKVSVN
jgi:hypothetical protein